MSGATRAAPRDKQVAFQSQRYKVTETVHFINGRLHQPGEIVVLPEGVKPGKKLVAVGADGEPIKVKKSDQKDAVETGAQKPDEQKADGADKPADEKQAAKAEKK